LLPQEAAPAALWQAGPVPLTPIQRWFFAQPLQHPEHFNQALLLCMPEAVSSHHLQQAMEAVSAQHDVFTLCYEPSPTGWQQIARPPHLREQGNCEPLLVVDLSRLAAAQQSACITELARGWQGSLHLQHGPLWRMIRFGCGQQADRVLWLAHHLLVDGVSWRILLDEVHQALSQLAQGQQVRLPAASTSFQHWARHLATTGLAVSRGHADFWLAQARQTVAPLPRDLATGSNLRRDGQVSTLTLSAPETEALLRQTPRAYRTRIDEVLLAALLCTLSRWSGSRRVRLALEGHGREEAALGGSDLDLSRTVGWCTALYPLVLQVPAEGREDLGALLRSVKEQVRQVPQRGVGYGLLRWVAEKPEVRGVLEQEQEAEVSFNYLGQFDQSVQAQGWTLAPEVVAEPLSPHDPRGFLLEINAVIVEGRLTFGWWYSREIHRPEQIEALAQSYATDLRALLAYSQQQGEGRATPSDFPLARV